VNQSKTISDRPSRIDLDKKIEEKKGKGYRLVGEWFPGSRWSHQRQVATTTPTAPPSRNKPAGSTPPLSSKVMSEWLSDRNSDQWF
jgi:hypothetical protein